MNMQGLQGCSLEQYLIKGCAEGFRQFANREGARHAQTPVNGAKNVSSPKQAGQVAAFWEFEDVAL